MSPGFRVDPDVLDMNARRLDGLAARVGAAAEGGRPLDLAAYGLVGRVFAVAVDAATGTAAAAVAGLAARAAGQAGRLGAAAADYREAEHAAAVAVGGPR